MSAPIPPWIDYPRAIGVIAREMQMQRGVEPAVLEALADGSIRARRWIGSITGHPFEEVTELAPEFWRNQKAKAGDPWSPWIGYSDHEKDQTVTFEFHYPTLREWLSPAKLKADTRGRPFKWDWDRFWIEAVLLADTRDGLPDKQADFEVQMAMWFEEKTGKSPAESTIRERASKLYQAKKLYEAKKARK